MEYYDNICILSFICCQYEINRLTLNGFAMIPIRDNVNRRTLPFFTITLMAVNVFIFFFQITLGTAMDEFIALYAVVPAKIYAVFLSPLSEYPVLITLITSLFIHGSLFHLLGNMMYLWVFGGTIESRLGHARFLFFYLLTGIIATLVHCYFYLESAIPLIGASGAIAGVLGAYFFLYPLARIQVLIPLFIIFPVVHIPALIFLGVWFIIQVWSGWTSMYYDMSTGIAWFAHAGGFGAGALLLTVFVPRKRY
jgi:membrane associated rhomboid family serine protease